MLSGLLTPGSPLIGWQRGSFRGGAGNDGLHGIAAWNEHSDHVSVTGFAPGTNADTDIDILTVALFNRADPANPTSTVRPVQQSQLLGEHNFIRTDTVGDTGNELPTALGVANATTLGGFAQFGLGDPQGGGIAVDQRGRVHVVGATDSPNLLFTTAPNFNAGRPFQGGQDAVRTATDMQPVGVWRTDATGVNLVPAIPAAATMGFTGATTPTCGLLDFGALIGGPVPQVRRINIDYDGVPPAGGVAPTILLDRPPADATVIGVALQVGPATQPLGLTLGVEIWTNNSPITIIHGPQGGILRIEEFPLSGLPAGSGQFAVQGLMLVSSPLCSGFDVVASPALTIEY